MSVQGEDSTGPDESRGESHALDGLINFSQYSLAQLKELQFTIDRRAFPRNFDGLLAELARRALPLDASLPAGLSVAGRFSSRDGLRGWLEATRRHSSVYGQGDLRVTSTEVILGGWRRTWLGVPFQIQIGLPLETIRNVASDGSCVRFESKQSLRRTNIFEFQASSAEEARRLVAALPSAQTAGFATKNWTEIREFNRRLNAVAGSSLITHAIVLLNVAVFVTMAGTEKGAGGFDLQQLLKWGGNFGALTVNGQWWRLLSAAFVHVNAAHLLINMWAFWNVGRMSERIYGRSIFLALYLVAAVFGSLASIAWDLNRVSIGASGAIFGIFGAFLAYFLRHKSRVPGAVFRTHWISTAVFVLFSLLRGFSAVSVDNAAHVGGLLSGFVLGWILALPLEADVRRRSYSTSKILAAVVLTLIAGSAALWQVSGRGAQLTIPEQYFQAHAWYMVGEGKNLRRWQELAAMESSGNLSRVELRERFKQEIVSFWQDANSRLQTENELLRGPQRPFALLVADFVKARFEWAHAIATLQDEESSEGAQSLTALMQRTDSAQARIERASLRAGMEHRPRALSNNALVVAITRMLSTGTWKCVEAPADVSPALAPTDSKTDGPAIHAANGCTAQRLFMSGDYKSLDRMMLRYAGNLSDLPDGGSSFSGVVDGLSNLFAHGTLNVAEGFSRTADWRRAVTDPVQADLVEAMQLNEWAWSARGMGSANSVSPQAWALFRHRNAMADAALQEDAVRAGANPLWHVLSLDVGLDQSLDVEKLRAVFDRAATRFPTYLPLYRRMLRILMPRWRGSYETVDDFVNQMSAKAPFGSNAETYARLYWIYDSLERDDINIFDAALADWPRMKSGLEKLRARYPNSDIVLNAYARFACLADDVKEYVAIRPQLKTRTASDAWRFKVSVASCDTKFAHPQKHASTSPRLTLGGGASQSGSTESPVEVKAREAIQRAIADAGRRSDWLSMRTDARRLIEMYPNWAYGYAMAGHAEERAREYEAAKSDYRRAVRFAPQNADDWYALAWVELATHDYHEAVADLTRTIEINPKNWSAWSDRAAAHQALGEDAAALEDAQKACQNGFQFACRLAKEMHRPKAR